MMTREKWQGHGIILLVNILFAVNLPISKSLIPDQISPDALTLLRSVFACMMFWLVSLFVKNEKVCWKDLGMLGLCALCGIALNTTLFMSGLNLTSPVDASIIGTAGPIYVMLLAAVILKEPITVKKAAGVLLGVIGAVLMILTSVQGASSDSGEEMNGAIRIVLSNLMYSIYMVLSRPLSQKYSPITIMKWMFLFSTLMLAPFMYRGALEAPVLHYDTIAWKELGYLFYVLMFATFVPYMLIPMSLKRLRPTTVSMYSYIQPIVASFLAVMVGQGSFTLWKLVSTLFVFTGVYLVTQSKSRADVEREMKEKEENQKQQ